MSHSQSDQPVNLLISLQPKPVDLKIYIKAKHNPDSDTLSILNHLATTMINLEKCGIGRGGGKNGELAFFTTNTYAQQSECSCCGSISVTTERICSDRYSDRLGNRQPQK